MKNNILSNICSFVDEKIAVYQLDLVNYISTENMLPNKEGVSLSAGLPNTVYTQAYHEGDVLISNIRPYFRKIWYADKCGGCSNDVLVLRANDNVNSHFLYYLLSEDNFFDYTTVTAKGTKMPRGDKNAIMQYKVPDLQFDLQVDITKTLAALDAQIFNNKNINHHLADSISETRSSPDIKRGKRVSRMVVRRRFSEQLFAINCII